MTAFRAVGLLAVAFALAVALWGVRGQHERQARAFLLELAVIIGAAGLLATVYPVA